MISLLAVVLVSEFASAADPFKIVSAKWLPSGKQIETITFGDDIDFSVSVPYNRDMMGCYLMKARVSVTLYEKDSRQLVYSFLNEKLLTREEINKGFFANYHIDQDVYDNIGQYYVEVYKTEAWMGCWYGVENVRELLTHRIYLDVEQAEEPTPVIPIPILSEPDIEVDENSAYSYQLVSMAKNGGELKYSLTQSPSWLSINRKTGLVSGIAPEVNSNTGYNIIIKVSEEVCTSRLNNKCGRTQEVTSSTQHYTLIVKDTNSTNHEPVCGDDICEAGEDCPADCEEPEDDDDEENNYFYKDVYETKYLQESDARKPAKTITLVEPETLRAKKGFWALLWESIVEFFGNLF